MNLSLFYFLNHLASSLPWIDSPVIFFGKHLPYILVLFIGVYIFVHHDRRRGTYEAVAILFSAVLAWGFVYLFKHFYFEPRPFEVLQDVVLLFPHAADAAFPSGHATFFAALAAAMFLYHKRLGVFLAVCAFLIGVSRVIAGVHWPIDILAGFLIGGFLGWVIASFCSRYLKKHFDNGALPLA